MLEWRPVVGYEGRYQVSSTGLVFSEKTKKILRPADDKRGYLGLTLYHKGGRRTAKIHILVAEAFLKPIMGFVANHKDGNKCNNCDWNLEYITQRDNVKHAYRMGLRRKK